MNSARTRSSRTLLPSACVIALGVLAGAAEAQQDKLVKIDGSSTVFPVSEAVAEEFQTAQKGKVHVTVGISGTGGGFKKFVRGEIDISNASRPILESEMKLASEAGIEYLELPICFDALTVAVHPKNDWVDHLTVEELRKIWAPEAQGTILYWDQVREGWPHEKLDLYGAGSDSGTFDYFTEAIVGKAKSSRGDYTASEDDNVLVRGIEGNRYALGYIPFAYYSENASRMKAVPIDWEKDEFGPTLPDMQNVTEGRYNPLSRPLFIYVNRESLETKPWVRDFVQFYLENVAELATEVKYLPLPDRAYQMCRERLEKLETGTGFGGKPEVGLAVEEILKRPPQK